MIGGEKMDQKTNHYDGSVLFDYDVNNETKKQISHITDEIRLNIGGNPYFFDLNELTNS
jgi:hypothetical protein